MIFILAIAGFIGFFYLNGRINQLQSTIERIQKGNKGTATSFEAQPLAQIAPVIEPTQSIPVAATPLPEYLQEASSSKTESSEELGGRWLGKIGIIAVLIGVSFFLKYAFDNNLIGVQGRIILGILAGIVLVGLGQFLRAKYLKYSDILIGGGIGVLYLTIFAAFAFYHLISQPVALAIIGLITIVSIVLSIVDDAITLATLGIIGGFLTPLLISFDHDSMFSLFSYVLCLDIGVLIIALYKHWPKLNYVAFAGTILTYLIWYTGFYRKEDLFIAFFFLTLYFLAFLASSIAHHIVRKEKTNEVDLILLSINALGYFGLGYSLLNTDFHSVIGYFSFILAVVYFVISYICYITNPDDGALNLYVPGIAVLFLTITIPLQVSGMWIALAWIIESVILAFVGITMGRVSYSLFAIFVYIAGLLKLIADTISSKSSLTPFVNHEFFLYVVAVIAAYCLGYIYYTRRDLKLMNTNIKDLVAGFLVLANILTVFAFTSEVSRVYAQQIQARQITIQSIISKSYNYSGDYQDPYSNPQYKAALSDINSLKNQKNTMISILWAIYATILLVVGFSFRSKLFRMFGLIFFFIIAFKVFIDVWSLGQLYRIISSIVFGVIALIGSFVYAKYRHVINEMIQ